MFKSLIHFEFIFAYGASRASHVVLVVKNLPANAGDRLRCEFAPGWRRSPGGRRDNPLQYSFLKNPMNRGAWQTIAHRLAKSQDACSDLHALMVLGSFLISFFYM